MQAVAVTVWPKNPNTALWLESATSGKAGGLKNSEPLKAESYGEPLKAVR
jgi:hypothetical protein